MKINLSALLEPSLYAKVLLKSAFYRNCQNRDEIQEFQRIQFNKIWKDAYSDIPFYRKWKIDHNLPNEINSIAELKNWPVLSKKELQLNIDDLIRNSLKPYSYSKTGGSTGQPLVIPTWKDQVSKPNMLIGRAGYQISPSDKMFLVWGHHHLYGKGLSRQIKLVIRKLKDSVLRIKRVSAYNLSQDSVKAIYQQLIKYEPEYVLGFSPAVLAISKLAEQESFKPPNNLKAVICTAGPLNENDKKEIETFFNAPVCMEYGSVECGVMAYTNKESGQYKVFWDTHLLQGEVDENNMVKNIVTTIGPLYLPLIRYDIGDYLDIDREELKNHSILDIKEVAGRPSEFVVLKNGISFFGALIGDCVKQVPGILSNQLFVFDDQLGIQVVANRKLVSKDFDLIQNRLIGVIPELNNIKIKFVQVDSHKSTPGGKIPLVIRE